MSILAAMLGSEVEMLPNSYHKNRGVFEKSLCHFDNVRFPERDLTSSDTETQVAGVPIAERLAQLERHFAFTDENLQNARSHNLKLGAEVQQLRFSYNSVTEELSAAKKQLEIANVELHDISKNAEYRLLRRFLAIQSRPTLGKPLRVARRTARWVYTRLRP
jgi:septal ring factor EnvC (AmiA/AmiB activator)